MARRRRFDAWGGGRGRSPAPRDPGPPPGPEPPGYREVGRALGELDASAKAGRRVDLAAWAEATGIPIGRARLIAVALRLTVEDDVASLPDRGA